jgi:predicted negative regulator of RcsB-dependent stress response
MRNAVIVVVIAAAAFLGWKKYQSSQTPASEPAPVTDSHKTPGANAENRVNGLSGAAPAE